MKIALWLQDVCDCRQLISMLYDTDITGILAIILMLYRTHNYDINIKWDQLMSLPTLKIMDEKFIASCRAQHDIYNELPGCIRYLNMLSLGLLL